jgi:5-methylcytosine-specific restriction endonuclease McrA
MDHQTLVLNADYTPIAIIPWQRAVILTLINKENVMKGAEMIDHYKNRAIQCTNNRQVPMPAVVRIPKYVKRTSNTIPFSRKNVFIRDNYTCLYCGNTFQHDELTYDHVTPRSKWKGQSTPTNWENIVTCCLECNRKKGDKTPEQAGMKLMRKPKQPSIHQVRMIMCPWKEVPEEWQIYLGTN